MASIAPLGIAAILGISAYMFPNQIIRIRSLIVFILGHIFYNLLKTSKQPEIIGQGKLKHVLAECSNVLKDTYHPTPWCVGPHMHSISRVIVQHVPEMTLHREYIPTSDGGQFALDWLANDKLDDDIDRPIVMVVPGITGGSHNNYVRQLMANGQNNNCRTLAFTNRGCSYTKLLTTRLYSGSNTEDMSLAISTISDRYPNAPITVLAVSLGGMITTHYLASEKGVASNVKAACIISSPWNAFGTSHSISKVSHHLLYEKYLLGKLKRIVQTHEHLFVEKDCPYDYKHMMKATSLKEWDNRYTSRAFGYKGWEDYYSDGHSSKQLPNVSIPTLIISAEDDPISPADHLPYAEVNANPNVAMVLTKTGGHIGFLEGWCPTGPAWLNRVVDDFLQIMISSDFLVSNVKKETMEGGVKMSNGL